MELFAKFSIIFIITIIAIFHLLGNVVYSREDNQVSEKKESEPQKSSSLFDPSGFSTSFNNGQYEYVPSGIRVFANKAKDPGVYFETTLRNVSGYKFFTFEIKGTLERLGQWCFPVVQIYDLKDDDYTPSITKTSFTFNSNEFTTIVIPLEGKISDVAKIQFMLVTDRGSWDVKVLNARFE